MLSVMIWNNDETEGEDCLATFYSEEHVQVPRKGDILWLETDKVRHSRWKVANVQWSFNDRTLGISRDRSMRVEIWVRRYSTAPLWRQFVELFPRAA